MKKKLIITLALLSLVLVPFMAQAVEFKLGGYVKMETIWDSTNVDKNLLRFPNIGRNNAPGDAQHGRLKFTAQNTRMNFLMKGPEVFGAKTTGFIEWDFEARGDNRHNEGLRIRHAMFRLNWPETELMLGKYWSMLTEEIPETVNFGACTTAGAPFLRTPQIRLTQKFLGDWTVAVALAEPVDGRWNGDEPAGNANTGESSETPQVNAKIKYSKDLWGKGAYWGKPRPFSARVAFSWQRSRYTGNWVTAGRTWGQNNYVGVVARQRDQQYLDKWLVEGSLFIPIIPTYTKNLAGTLSLLTQWWVGQGMDMWLEDSNLTSTYLVFQRFNPITATFDYDRELQRRWGGFAQLTYYFTNQWFLNAVYGINRGFDISNERDPNAPGGYKFATVNAAADPVKMNQHYYLALYYRPIQALKFGLEYTYVRTDYFQYTTVQSERSDYGDNHRLMFGGFFFF
ncbi:MAG: hypothetical protein DRG58_08095 [Deltaproteobacteria bacterium]|nr:MAG: hypothetical protein DRG58_08095 [Deltaproteobacteria bacterium]